jgi:hypothetical protein
MPRYNIEAVAYDKNGRRLNGNTHGIDAANQRDALEIAKSRQRSHVDTAKVEVRVLSVYDK